MAMSYQSFFQIGGFRPAVQWFPYDDKKLANAVGGEGSPLRAWAGCHPDIQLPLELVLGIKRTGTSHLLLTYDQIQLLCKTHSLSLPRSPPSSASEFESLSPVYFADSAELEKWLSCLKPKGGKKGGGGDNSKYNKSFFSGEEGVPRGAFEHGRVFHHLLFEAIERQKFAIPDTAWKNNVRVLSFVFNERSNDQRPLADRISNPVLLDVGVAVARLPNLSATEDEPQSADYQLDSSSHFLVEENRYLTRTNPSGERLQKQPFMNGKSELLKKTQIGEKFRDVFEAGAQQQTILLVHNEQVTMNALRNFGVDTSSWKSGLQHLLGSKNGPDSRSPRHYESRRMDSRRYSQDTYHDRDRFSRDRYRDDAKPTQYQDEGRQRVGDYRDDYKLASSRRSRSRSPRRDRMGSSSSSYRRRSPSSGRLDDVKPAVRTLAPVYVVDVNQLFSTLMHAGNRAKGVADVAREFGLKAEHGDGWCAGNEAGLIIKMWWSMISGPPIDEQWAHREYKVFQAIHQPTTVAQEPFQENEDEDDMDPNDIRQVQDSTTGTSRSYTDWESDDGCSDED